MDEVDSDLAKTRLPDWLPHRKKILAVSKRFKVSELVAASALGRRALSPFLRYVLSIDDHVERPLYDLGNALLAAVACDSGEAVEALILGAGADPFENIGGATATHMAAFRGCCEALRVILDFDHTRKATYVRDNFGACPVHVAAWNGEPEAVYMLIQHDAAALIVTADGLLAEYERDDSSCDGESFSECEDIYDLNLFLTPYFAEDSCAWFFSRFSGTTAAHIAAMQGELEVLQEIMRAAYIVECGPPVLCNLRDLHGISYKYACAARSKQGPSSRGFNPVTLRTGQYGASMFEKMQQFALAFREGTDRVSASNGRPLKFVVKAVIEDILSNAIENIECSSSRDIAPFVAVSISVSMVLEAQDSELCTPILRAVKSKERHCVEALFRAGANLYAKTFACRSALHLAFLGDSTEMLDALIDEYNFPVDEADEDLWTTLHYAAYGSSDRCPSVSKLLHAGANVNAKSLSLLTPLKISAERLNGTLFMHIVRTVADMESKLESENLSSSLVVLAEYGYFDALLSFLNFAKINKSFVNLEEIFKGNQTIFVECVTKRASVNVLKQLLAAGARLDRDADKASLLAYAVDERQTLDLERASVILKAGDGSKCINDYIETLLYYAANNDRNLSLLKSLIDKCGNVDAVIKKDYEYYNHSTPLHRAAAHNAHKIVRLLLKAGVSHSFARRIDRKTPLHVAIQHKAFESAKALVEAGADLYARDFRGYVPFHSAVQSESCRMISYLLEAGTSVAVPAYWGITSLHLLMECGGDLGILNFLISKGAEVNSPSKRGTTPLHACLTSRFDTSVCGLIEANADITLRDENGHDALLCASMNSSLRNLVQLLSVGACPDSRNSKGQTALHLAVENGELHITRFLLQNGANVLSTDRNGLSVINSAIASSRTDAFWMIMNETGGLDALTERIVFAVDSPCASDDGWHYNSEERDVKRQLMHETKCEMDHTRATCDICRLVLRNGDEVRKLQCNHVFHDPCIMSWFSSERGRQCLVCPYCRRSLVEQGDA